MVIKYAGQESQIPASHAFTTPEKISTAGRSMEASELRQILTEEREKTLAAMRDLFYEFCGDVPGLVKAGVISPLCSRPDDAARHQAAG